MKKALLSAAAMLLVGMLTAQTIVSTAPSNRNAILEEFTGVNCGYCPDGHRLANLACAAHPGHAWAINIHTGSFAAQYYTQWGAAIASQANLDGYPAGTVNRHNFGNGQNSGGTAMSRGDFAASVNAICNMPSPVNVAAEGTIVGRTLTLHIEVFYTGDAANATNLLNVAMLQNNVIGPQGGAAANPDFIVGSQYRHMHMLRDMLTGQWGISIPATQDSFFDTTIVYDIPQAISGTESGHSGASTVQIGDKLKDLEFIVFVAENHQEILSGVKASVVLEHPCIDDFSYDHTTDCALEYEPYVKILNNTNKTVTNFTFTYDGQAVTSTKLISPMSEDTIHMPTYVLTITGENEQNCATTKSVTFDSYEDFNDGTTHTINSDPWSVTMSDFSVYNVEGPVTAVFKLDQYAKEASIKFREQQGCATLFEKAYTQAQNNKTITQIFSPANPGYYTFTVFDSYGDGMSSNAKGVTLADASGNIFWRAMGNYGFHKECWMNFTNAGSGEMAIDAPATVNFEVYPNPVSDQLNIECSEAVSQVDILDMAGRTVVTERGNVNSVNTQALSAGVYMLRVVTGSGVATQKFVKE